MIYLCFEYIVMYLYALLPALVIVFSLLKSTPVNRIYMYRIHLIHLFQENALVVCINF